MEIVVSYTEQPIIGILGDPITGGCDVFEDEKEVLKLWQARKRKSPFEQTPNSCFTSFYVQWIEQGGGRVVPIRYDTPVSELIHLFKSLNGILFTGGGLSLSLNTTYVKTANAIFDLATSNYSDFFPLWGTCQGFQLLNVLQAQDPSVVVSGFDAEDISFALELTSIAYSSRLFSNLPDDVVKILATKNVTMNFHHAGVTPETYESNSRLNRFYSLLSVNQDRKGRTFTSTMEAKNWPIYATQWHPERQQFEFNTYDTGLSHTYDSIKANSAVGAFFVNECRKCNHYFSNKTEEAERLIYNYVPLYTPPGSTQIYMF